MDMPMNSTQEQQSNEALDQELADLDVGEDADKVDWRLERSVRGRAVARAVIRSASPPSLPGRGGTSRADQSAGLFGPNIS